MILVTGATGRLGNYIVRALRSVNLEVRCLVRKGSEYYWLNDTGSHYFFGDLRDPKSISRAMRDVKYLVAASGVRVEKTDNHHGNVTKDGHIALFDAAKARGTVEHVVFVSCAGVAHGGDVPAFTNKKAAEDHLVQSGLPYTILRPGLFAANFADLVRRVEFNGSVFLPGRPDTMVSPIAGRDMALMCLASLELPAVRNRIVDVGGPETLSVKDAFAIACEVAGVQPSSWAMPSSALRTLATLATPLGKRWNHYLRALDVYFSQDSAVDGNSMSTTFGIPLTPFREAVRIAWEDRHPGEDPIAREEKVVHRQFTATIYEPGVSPLDELPTGPPPRQD